MTFREMLIEDLDQVMEIETDLFAMPWTKEGMFTFLTREDTMFFVVQQENGILLKPDPVGSPVPPPDFPSIDLSFS